MKLIRDNKNRLISNEMKVLGVQFGCGEEYTSLTIAHPDVKEFAMDERGVVYIFWSNEDSITQVFNPSVIEWGVEL